MTESAAEQCPSGQRDRNGSGVLLFWRSTCALISRRPRSFTNFPGYPVVGAFTYAYSLEYLCAEGVLRNGHLARARARARCPCHEYRRTRAEASKVAPVLPSCAWSFRILVARSSKLSLNCASIAENVRLFSGQYAVLVCVFIHITASFVQNFIFRVWSGFKVTFCCGE